MESIAFKSQFQHSYTQMVANWLGVPEDKIHLLQADTDEVAIGRGTYASRSMMIGGSALRAAADEVIARGKRFAAHFMEADTADIAFVDAAHLRRHPVRRSGNDFRLDRHARLGGIGKKGGRVASSLALQPGKRSIQPCSARRRLFREL